MKLGKTLLKGKSYGFFVTLALIVLTVVTGIVYCVNYSGSRYMSVPAAVLLFVGAAAALALCLTKWAGWANAVLALCGFAALLFYIYGIYFYVSIVMVGIQASSFNSQFVTTTALFVVLLALNIINVFLKQVKEGA